MKNLIQRFREWRDRRFRERIDRVYFRCTADGVRFIDGYLLSVKDGNSGLCGFGVATGQNYKEALLALQTPPDSDNGDECIVINEATDQTISEHELSNQ